jgi:hypothetical protein
VPLSAIDGLEVRAPGDGRVRLLRLVAFAGGREVGGPRFRLENEAPELATLEEATGHVLETHQPWAVVRAAAGASGVARVAVTVPGSPAPVQRVELRF